MSATRACLGVVGLCTCLLVSFDAAHALPTTVYFNDFEHGAGPEWSHRATDTTPVGGREFLGRFSTEVVTLSLPDLPPHTELGVSFELFIIESMDGLGNVQGMHGPDIWSVSVLDGPALLRTTFSNASFDQSYPSWYGEGRHPRGTGASEIGTLGYPTNMPDHIGDSVYQLSFSFPHTSDSVGLGFSGAELVFEGPADTERWGVDNVAVSAIPEPSTFVLLGMGAVGLLGYAWRRRRQIA